MSINRSEILRKEVLNFFEVFINDLIALCESEIEKQTLLLLIKYIFSDQFRIKVVQSGFVHPNDFVEWHFTNLDRINDHQGIIEATKGEIEYLEQNGYEFYGPEMIKTIGVKFRDEHDWEVGTYTEYKLIPQYKLELNNNYRLDFALLGKHFRNNTSVKESKIAIECDGYEFHSKKEDLKKDNQKNRELQLNGWIVYRLSGSEIFEIDNMSKIASIFKDLRTFSK